MEKILKKKSPNHTAAIHTKLLDKISDSVFLVSLRGDIVYVNKTACQSLGYTRDELMKIPLRVLDVTGKADKIKTRIKGYIKRGNVVFETAHLRKDKSVMPIELNISVIRLDKRIFILGVARDITERKKIEEKMQTYQKKLQLLNSQLSEAEEQERRRLATELHDSIGQKLALLKMKLGIIRQSEPSQNVLKQLDECGKVFEEMINDTRSLTFQLSPPLLHQIGLNATVEWLAEKINKEHGLEFELEKPEKEHPLNEKLRFLVYHCIQELLTNVIKHSQAHKVGLSIRQDGDLMKIMIEDDGVGFDPHALGSSDGTEGFGLFSIRERLSNLGGLFKVDSAPGRGTRVSLVIPVDNDG